MFGFETKKKTNIWSITKPVRQLTKSTRLTNKQVLY